MLENKFKIKSSYKPSGDQPQAIEKLVNGILNHKKNQVLLGVTGSGKTFTMANIIESLQRPALIMAHNKTLAAQIYEELKEYFPDNAVEYFVSYYDYYQPEAYLPKSDTYIEKDSAINEQIDLLRHSATRSLIERRDVIVVSSISCIYGLGDPAIYAKMIIKLYEKEKISISDLAKELVKLQYERNDIEFKRNVFRIKGDSIDIIPSHFSEYGWRLSFFGNEIESIHEIDVISGKKIKQLKEIVIYASSHFVTPMQTIEKAMVGIKAELKERLDELRIQNKFIEMHRLDQRTKYDLEMLKETGSCKGIENYSRFLTGRKPGEPPPTLFEYLPQDAVLFIDESHATIPQVRAMYNGDRARKTNLVDYGFRIPAALDNRPLKFEEWDQMRPQTIFVSATPSPYELELTGGEKVEQVIRPTGLLDPECIVRPTSNQVDDLLSEIVECKAKGQRVLVTCLTKKMAENLSNYLNNDQINVTYLHSEIKTLERIQVIQSLRRGDVDAIVGINLLREGLDIPECGLVAILDADKEGFLRSETSLIQTIGRAARNANSRVILYADEITKSMEKALNETKRRRKIQAEYNTLHNITPTTVTKTLKDEFYEIKSITPAEAKLDGEQLLTKIAKLQKEMFKAASDLEFEKASKLRDEIKHLEYYINKV